MNELLAQLDSNDTTVQAESANLINDMDLNQQAAKLEAKEKQDAKSRFKARQVCVFCGFWTMVCSSPCFTIQARKAALLAQSYAPDNPEHQARLEQEAKDEDVAIRKVCKDFSLEITEVRCAQHLTRLHRHLILPFYYYR